MEEKQKELIASQENENKVEVEKEESPYKLYGYDISTANPLIKDFYTESMKLLVKANLLVGDFDDKGNYIIKKEIKRDIVVMDKEIEEKDEKFFKATSLYMKKNFYYFIPIIKTDDGKAKAKLYLYEYVGDYLDKEFVVSHIATYSDEFMGKVKKAFNLVDVDVPNNDFETPNLAIRMQQMLDSQVRAKDLYELACQDFVKTMSTDLEKTEIGKLILDEYKSLLASFKGTMTPAIQKAMLDRVVNKYGGYEKVLNDNAQVKAIIEKLIKSCQDIANLKEEKKEDASVKAKDAKPKAAGAKKGGSAKKPAKKDDKKKSAKKGGKKDKKDDKKKSGGGVSLTELAKLVQMYRKLLGLDKADKEKQEEKTTPKTKPESQNSAKENQQEFIQSPKVVAKDIDEFDVQAEESAAMQTETKEVFAVQVDELVAEKAQEGREITAEHIVSVEVISNTSENLEDDELAKQIHLEEKLEPGENLNQQPKINESISSENDEKYLEEDFPYIY